MGLKSHRLSVHLPTSLLQFYWEIPELHCISQCFQDFYDALVSDENMGKLGANFGQYLRDFSHALVCDDNVVKLEQVLLQSQWFRDFSDALVSDENVRKLRTNFGPIESRNFPHEISYVVHFIV